MVRPGRANIYAGALDAVHDVLDPVEDLVLLHDAKGKAAAAAATAAQAAARDATAAAAAPAPLTAADVAACLTQRLQKDEVFTRIGARGLVAVRPARALPGSSDAASKDYAAAAKQLPASPNAKPAAHPPHVFGVAASAYQHMLRHKLDQAVVLHGESASGKSESLRMLLRSLCDISKTSKKKTKTQSAILKADPVLAAFGNATTPSNPNATCFVRYNEVQFDAAGRMVGIKLIESLLEKSRVSGPADGGHSFHIFYYLLEGASHEERVQWHLSDAAHFRFLNLSKMRTVGFAQGKGSAPLDDLRESLKTLGIGRRQQTQLWQLLAAILHLGNVTFSDPPKDGEPCGVRNFPQLQLVADMLGLPVLALQTVLTTRSRFVGSEVVSALLDAQGAARQRDSFASALYAVAFDWIVEQINQRLCMPEPDWSNFVSIVEAPGLAGTDTPDNGFYRLLANFANEQLLAHTMSELFDVPREAFVAQTIPFPEESPFSRDVVNILAAPRTGVIPLVDHATARKGTEDGVTAKIYECNLDSPAFVSSSSKKLSHAFGIRHFAGMVEYDVRGFAQQDADILQSDFVTLVRGNPEQPGTTNVFLRSIFSSKLIATRISARDGNTVVSANNKGRFPSLRRKKTGRLEDEDESLDASATLGHEFRSAFSSIIDAIAETQSWFIFHIKPFDGSSNGRTDMRAVERQVAGLHLAELASNPAMLYTSIQPHAEFIARYKSVVSLWEREPKAACESLYRYRNWTRFDAIIGTTSIFLGEVAWRSLEDKLRAKEIQEEMRKAGKSDMASSSYQLGGRSTPNISGTTTPVEDAQFPRHSVEEMFSDSFNNIGKSLSHDSGSNADDSDTGSHFESEFEYGDSPANVAHGKSRGTAGANDIELGNIQAAKKTPPPKEVKPMSRQRCCWLSITWATTFCFLPPCLSICGCMKTKDRQIAWREKVALCVIIFLMNAAMLFIIVGLGYVLCPRKAELSPGEVSGLFTQGPKAAVYMYGSYYYIPEIVTYHVSNYMDASSATVKYFESQVLGQDVSVMFPRDYANQWSAWCPNFVKPAGFSLRDPIPTGSKWYPHIASNKDYTGTLRSNRKGDVVWDYGTISTAISDQSRRFLTIYDRIYEVTPFYNTALNPSQINNFFLGSYFKNVSDLNSGKAGVDSTPLFEYLRRGDPTQHDSVMACLNGLFYIGKVDHRNDLKCVVPNYILLAASIILVAVVVFKFMAALQFGSRKEPEDGDKFVICMVPCYTEGETSLRRTIDSLSTMRYDDKHKLLFVICDGMIIGSGNDRPTPRIVLDILGVDPSVDPDVFAFQSLGEGNAQLNYGKIYSGLYEISGRVVPFIVVVKVGKPSERGKPGNRGKRDSQMVLMRFLSRVHFNQPMAPLELELFHQMKNVIGVDPSFYEFIFMVDADTQVMPDSLNHLVSHMTRDARISGACGETQIANERKSFTSMIQVYEYFISHHIAKAFESLFGSVTCLPGCFSIYRIRTSTKNVPVLIAPGIIKDYSENNVDTLHLKNLLHLGEDRYLTTLILKHFPHMKTSFTPDAKCQTYAPDRWSVLLSQRRRWINSTVHNLFELLQLSELCGFCCFSMRFIVFLDLLATFIQPASLLYIGYLIYAAATDTTVAFSTISLIMIAAAYVLQILIFLLRTEWQYIGWMIIYLLAIPLFTFYIPLYAFWHFDDFSWGNTRKVLDEGKEVEKPINEVEWFDPDSVPLMKWIDYEAQRKTGSSDKDETRSVTSYQSGYTYKSGPSPPYAESHYGAGSIAPSYAGSAFGGGSRYQPVPSIHAPAPSTAGGNMLSLPRSMVSIGTTQGLPLGGGAPRAPGLPTDDEILREIRHILATTDLMKVTKKSVSEQLSRYFGVDLSSEKEYIHRCIDGVLRGEL